MPDQELTRALGRIEGKLDMIVDNQAGQSRRLDALDGRLRHVEQAAAKTGGIAGGVMGVGMALLTELAKRVL